jgi:molybdopterin molybdotransferase
MIDFESARRQFLEAAPTSGPEQISTLQALGRVLAEPTCAHLPVPEFDTSAMDGYAVRARDCEQLPFRLPVLGEAAAGGPPGQLRSGMATRIFTGAAVPVGADCVVMQEHVTRVGDIITCNRSAVPGMNIRRRGEDLAESALAVGQGCRLTAGTLALLSSLDCAEIVVSKSPRVAVLCTGSELRRPGSCRCPGQIPDSNSIAIEALARQAGAVVVNTSIVPDDADVLHSAIDSALAVSDVLVTIGGVSVGDYDYARSALLAAGFTQVLHQVNIKPGKPITLGRRGEKIAIGLPGNPVSALITFALFAIPLLRSMQRDKSSIAVALSVRVATPLRRDPTRTRVILGDLVQTEACVEFKAHPNQASGATVALGQTGGFVIVSPGADSVAAGAEVPFHRWSDL